MCFGAKSDNKVHNSFTYLPSMETLWMMRLNIGHLNHEVIFSLTSVVLLTHTFTDLYLDVLFVLLLSPLDNRQTSEGLYNR